MRDFFKPHYRIVRDTYLSYSVQIWRWYWPLWRDVNPYRSFIMLEEAERYAAGCASIVVKNLGTLEGKGNE
jgi:hypothetical protein